MGEIEYLDDLRELKEHQLEEEHTEILLEHYQHLKPFHIQAKRMHVACEPGCPWCVK